MAWIVMMIILGIIAGIGVIIGWSLKGTEGDSPDARSARGAGGALIGISVVAFLLIGSLFTAYRSIKTLDEGRTGLVFQFGEIVDIKTGAGPTLIMPWQSLQSSSNQIETVRFERISAASEDTQDVFFDVTISYSVSPDAVDILYRRVGPDWYNKLIPPRVNDFAKQETVKYDAIAVTQQREAIRLAVKERLAQELSPYSISIDAVLIENISYSDEFNRAIEEKQVATQNALREQEKVKQSQYQAEQAVEVAKGRAEVLRTEAQGQADANNTLTQSITPELIQWQAVESLSDNIQIALIPSGQGLILDPATLLTPKP